MTIVEQQLRMSERKQHVIRAGEGSPLVIFESGCGGTAEDWLAFFPSLAARTSVLAYDRLGNGRSDPGPLPRLVSTLAGELQALLGKCSAEAPYILVGLSLGALIVREFAVAHREKVAGILLVEPAHENLLTEMPAALWEDEKRQWERAPTAVRVEAEAIEESSAQMRARGFDLGDIPLIVLTATVKWNELPRGLTRGEVEPVWIDLHRRLASSSTRSSHWMVERSGHNMHRDRPDVILLALERLLRVARGESLSLAR